jgi:hypothetical protein
MSTQTQLSREERRQAILEDPKFNLEVSLMEEHKKEMLNSLSTLERAFIEKCLSQGLNFNQFLVLHIFALKQIFGCELSAAGAVAGEGFVQLLMEQLISELTSNLEELKSAGLSLS